LSPASAPPGTTASVAIATEYTNFVQGSTQANFGPGVSVGGGPDGGFGPVTVTSPTSATAALTISTSAAGGPRTTSVRTGVQSASTTTGFAVVPSNMPPSVNAGPNQTIK